MKTALLIVVLIVAAVLVAVRAGILSGNAPTGLGVHDGRLAAPSATPNSVHSQAAQFAGHPQQATAAIAPLAFAGDGPATMARLQALVAATPGARIVEQRANYLRVEFQTRWLRFVDDAEFWLDPGAGVIQLRSASRLGKGDFGVNRQRIEALRRALSGGSGPHSGG